MLTKTTISFLVLGLLIGSLVGSGAVYFTLTPQLDAARTDISALSASLANLRTDLASSQAEGEKANAQFLNKLDNLQNAYDKLATQNAQLTDKLNNLQTDYDKIATDIGPLAAKVYQDARAGVVSITVYDQVGAPTGIGSGFVYSNEGYIITNNHVVEAGVNYLATFLDGSQVQATLIAQDPLGDIAVLSVRLPTFAKPLEIVDYDQLKVGEPVFAMGSPIGLIGSITAGIISQLNRTITDYSFLFYIQTDAPINPGNSGGPLLNSEAKVIGMNTFGFEKSVSEGLGFAIPSNILSKVIPELIENGRYDYPLIGIHGNFIDSLQAKLLNLPSAIDSGWLVEEIIPQSGASRSDLRVGDIILSIDGYTVRHEHDISYIMNAFYAPGDTVSLTVLRGSQTIIISLTLSSRQTG